jgi:hypothetical protein
VGQTLGPNVSSTSACDFLSLGCAGSWAARGGTEDGLGEKELTQVKSAHFFSFYFPHFLISIFH